jgi:hypothetical protein
VLQNLVKLFITLCRSLQLRQLNMGHFVVSKVSFCGRSKITSNWLLVTLSHRFDGPCRWKSQCWRLSYAPGTPQIARLPTRRPLEFSSSPKTAQMKRLILYLVMIMFQLRSLISRLHTIFELSLVITQFLDHELHPSSAKGLNSWLAISNLCAAHCESWCIQQVQNTGVHNSKWCLRRIYRYSK